MSSPTYLPWLDSGNGLRPHATKHNGENSIVFNTELILAKHARRSLNDIDILIFMDHVEHTRDYLGLYNRKNSHDNITAKIVGCLILEMSEEINCMSWWAMFKEALPFRPWDAAFYTYVKAPKCLKLLAAPLLILTGLQCMGACASRGKVRPAIYDRILHFIKTGTWLQARRMQNDGKILTLLKCYALRSNKIMNFFASKCDRILENKLGKNYQTALMVNYFEERDHPVRVLFKELDDKGNRLLRVKE